MKFISVNYRAENKSHKPIWIATNAIITIEPVNESSAVMTEITLRDGYVYKVKESAADILNGTLIEKAL